MLPRIDLIAVLRCRQLVRCRQLGTAGSILIVLGGILAGVPPQRNPLLHSPPLPWLRTFTTPTVACVFVGISLLVLAWWRVGRLVRGPQPPSQRELLTTLVWWAAPLALTTPIFSRDVYSYLAQGTMTVLGIDAYQYGPAILGGPLSLDIPAIWQTTPAPYGPVFLSLAADITSVTGESIWLGILGMRLLALGGLALMVWGVPRVARAAGVDPGAALWLGVLNPLVLVNLVGDAHNDALMIGFMIAGLALALDRRSAAGAALLALAALVKASAGLALVFIVPIWAGQLSGTARWLRASLGTAGVAAATMVATTTTAGTGYGWIGALDTPTLAHTWTSITTDLGYWSGLLVGELGWATPDQVLAWWRMAGLAAAGAVCLWLLRRYHRSGPVVGLGLGLAAVLALGPVVHPWYLLWAIVPLAAAARSHRIRSWVIGASVVMTFTVLPGGVRPNLDVAVGAVSGAALVFGIAWVARNLAWTGWLASGQVQALARQLPWARWMLPASQVPEREPVPVHAEAADDPGGDRRHHRMVPERLTRVDVGDVHLDQRPGQQGTGVAESVGVMGPRGGVEHHRHALVGGRMQPAEQLRLGVGLADVDGESQLAADPYTHVDEVGVRGEPVDVGLARTQAAQVRSVQYVHLHDETSR